MESRILNYHLSVSVAFSRASRPDSSQRSCVHSSHALTLFIFFGLFDHTRYSGLLYTGMVQKAPAMCRTMAV